MLFNWKQHAGLVFAVFFGAFAVTGFLVATYYNYSVEDTGDLLSRYIKIKEDGPHIYLYFSCEDLKVFKFDIDTQKLQLGSTAADEQDYITAKLPWDFIALPSEIAWSVVGGVGSGLAVGDVFLRAGRSEKIGPRFGRVAGAIVGAILGYGVGYFLGRAKNAQCSSWRIKRQIFSRDIWVVADRLLWIQELRSLNVCYERRELVKDEPLSALALLRHSSLDDDSLEEDPTDRRFPLPKSLENYDLNNLRAADFIEMRRLTNECTYRLIQFAYQGSDHGLAGFPFREFSNLVDAPRLALY